MSSESDDEDDLVTYGTPLEPLEEDEIPTKKPCLVEDQIVTDAQGRRRFHGAFTGGFSAGFFNTVGSLEGWKPSAFKSTKSEKRKIIEQKPEDFMDEEDFGEFGIAPVILKAKKDYMNKEKNESVTVNQSLGNFILKDLLKPVRENFGIKLLKKMGWKPGQGVGPRVTSSEKKKINKIREKVYGCQLPPGSTKDNEESDSSSDSEWMDFKFAPSDYEQIFNRKQDSVCGLGYSGLDKRPILGSLTQSKYHNTSKTVKNFGSQAFGVGAFEEEDDDIYSKEDMSRYDFSLGGNTKHPQENSNVKALQAEGVLDGFVLESKKIIKKHYPLPPLPKNFKPHHVIQISPSTAVKTKTSRWDDVDTNKGHSSSKVDTGSQLPYQKSEEDMSKLKKMREEDKKSTEELISKVTIKSSQFKPFASNEDKQKRYEQYLKLVEIKKTDCLESLQPISMSKGEREREKIEFARAAALFKPLTGGMEDRFSTASQPDDVSNPLAPVEKLHDENDSKKKAAKMKMYGKLTREIKEWVPCSLLCKRFNIPDPQKSLLPNVDKKPTKPVQDLFKMLDVQEESPITKPCEKKSEQSNSQEISVPELPKQEEKNIDILDSKKETILTHSTNKIDLFKEIFLSDEESEPETATSPVEKKEEEISGLSFEEKIVNSKRNTSPPKGLFENIDLEFLKEKKTLSIPKDDTVFSTNKNESLDVIQHKEQSTSENIYGPKLPERVEPKTVTSNFQNILDDGIWVEKTSTHIKKKKKKKEKSKKKSKHKHKKKSR